MSFIELVLDQVAGKEAYSMMDGFSGYKQIQLSSEAKSLTMFITKWDAFQCNVLLLGLCNGPNTFQRIMMMSFHKHFNKFMQIFLDDFSVYRSRKENLSQLQLCFERCRENKISMNLEKCIFVVSLEDHLAILFVGEDCVNPNKKAI